MADGKAWFQAEKDGIRRRLFKYTRRAFDKIPRMERPRILDAGCGSGVSSIELAKMSDCRITCIDIDSEILEVLRGKVRRENLENRIEVIELSILDMDFPEESFDIMLAEGSISAIGFAKGLKEWKRFIKPGGFLIIHDSHIDLENKIRAISAYRYELLDLILLGMDIWKDEYFIPLKKLVDRAQQELSADPEIAGLVNEASRELDEFKDNPYNNSSVCFIIKKNS